MELRGSCHCGNISVVLETARSPEELPVRACQCSFCLRHVALSTSDPDGHVTVRVADEGELSRYQFGLRSADFYVCRRCGVFMGAVMHDEGRAWAVVNINALDDRPRFTAAPQPMDYGGEDLAGRMARRKQRWTPATLG